MASHSKLTAAIPDWFRRIEYLAAAVVGIALYGGLIAAVLAVFNPAERYDSNDPAIYHWSTEQDFIEFMQEVGPISSKDLAEQIAIYRYHHSWRARIEGSAHSLLLIAALVVACVATFHGFRQYRTLQMRE